MICPHCNKQIDEPPPIADITRPPRSTVDETTREEADALKHVEAAWRNWKQDIIHSIEAFHNLPTSWNPRILATYRQRGMEFIKLVTPQVIHMAQIGKGQMTMGWGVVENYLDSDQYREHTRAVSVPINAPKPDTASDKYQEWQQTLTPEAIVKIVADWKEAHPSEIIPESDDAFAVRPDTMHRAKALYAYFQDNVKGKAE